ncbi:hypothetical protein HPP92_011171 [Vanilla planifolia]|uniref:AN1-type domain-containing protein n=1 Tax=Vanilla planifolia TaxID=51239 RepID=A0A835RBW2_VANPL|nr:hypothetical protein HPP92_011171 [Vanilla planifolia]
MARESCNLGKDEAEIFKPSSPSAASSPQNPALPSLPPSQLPSQQPPTCLLLKPSQDVLVQSSERPEPAVEASSLPNPMADSAPPVLFGNRCSTCRKRVGLTGFRCRCGDLFCARHRYSDTHDCSFDYKAAGREEISKANPVIRAAKIIKI